MYSDKVVLVVDSCGRHFSLSLTMFAFIARATPSSGVCLAPSFSSQETFQFNLKKVIKMDPPISREFLVPLVLT